MRPRSEKEISKRAERATQRATLETFLRASPSTVYSQSKLGLTPWMQAYSAIGLFGTDKTELGKINELVEAQKPYLDKHLDVMEEIKTRTNRKN